MAYCLGCNIEEMENIDTGKLQVAAFMKLKGHIKAIDDGNDCANPLLSDAGLFENYFSDGGDVSGAAGLCADRIIEATTNYEPDTTLTWADIDATVACFRTYVPTGKLETVLYDIVKF